MSEIPKMFDSEGLKEWQQGIEQANRNNIFCHCRRCDAEWVDSSEEADCPECGSSDVEHLCCWQFPDG
ncbi:hypothetical protein JJD41_15295 [Oxynema sp. CENA135]|jgi:hypothetical protein|uniref:Uncharacterized protein n=1 Tax=Oxynema aestuarii AP17 TaxID=2064643 RepID=A0A6H1U3I4_9CYAN|nr:MULTISPECIES: hypothetical protein [Oxynema]MBK4731217.1 hypothetical protein [Oxynema sp. CENA135]QIZ73215.1 hypothetical protein HCG48_23600 [Oxynema aestuarii AP17]RMH77539.1 MAG: hypothetical protein D6680_04840 [Cyanobacteria bacterium J007]